MTPTVKIIQGDCLTEMAKLPAESVHCCVTSPPYWGLRDYGVAGQIGLEKTPEDYVAVMVGVFREVRRVLRPDATCWINLGDSYTSGGRSTYRSGASDNKGHQVQDDQARPGTPDGLKAKDLCGVPWRVAFALQADGWYLRSEIIWHKKNCMPESVTDRPTKSHEQIFLLAKNERYFYDAEAIREESADLDGWESRMRYKLTGRDPTDVVCPGDKDGQRYAPKGFRDVPTSGTRNKRTVWTVATSPYSEAHFATFPPDLIKPCILAGTSAKGCCPKCGAPWERVVEVNGRKGKSWHDHSNDEITGQSKSESAPEITTKTIGWKPSCQCEEPIPIDWQPNLNQLFNNGPYDPVPCTVLDPFAGSGTTGQVALELGRNAILIELNPQYVKLANDRTFTTPGLPLA